MRSPGTVRKTLKKRYDQTQDRVLGDSAEQDAEFVACMEEVLETSAVAYDPRHPGPAGHDVPVQSNRPARHDMLNGDAVILHHNALYH